MQRFPQVDVSFKELYELYNAPIKLTLFLTGIELKVFDHLTEPESATTVAEAIAGHPKNTALFLDGLASMGLLKKKNGLFQNTSVSQTFLVEDSPSYLGQVFTHLYENDSTMRSDTLDKLPRLIREGPQSPSKEYTASDEMSEEDVLSYVGVERAGRAQRIARIASELPEFSSFHKMLDLGCGPGLNGISIIDAHPSMRGVAFDRPATIKIAKNVIKEYEMQDRIETLSGDYVQDSIGNGYDLVLASDTLYYNQDKMDLILDKIYAALNPGGVFMALHVGVTHERTQPEIYVLGTIITGLDGEDMGLLDQGVIADAMLQAGFKSVRSRTIETDWGPVDLDIARK